MEDQYVEDDKSRLLSGTGEVQYDSLAGDVDKNPYGSAEGLNLKRWENVGLAASYMTVGFCEGLSRTFLNVYPIDIGATEAQQATLSFIVVMPSTLKILFGFISDNYPILGVRRKPYMFIGWILASCSTWFLLLTSDIRPVDMIPFDPPSVGRLSLSFFFVGIGVWLADVMGDSIVAEKVRMEPHQFKGRLQSTCYACRFFGIMVTVPLSTFLYSYFSPEWVVKLIACVPLAVLPLIYMLYEPRCDSTNLITPPSSTREQMTVVWDLVCQRAVYQPIFYVYLYNLLQIPNAAWRQFLSVIGFTASNLNELLIISYVFLFFGALMYKRFMLKSSWRRTYQLCILTNCILSGLQLLLIRGITLGLPSFWFALGDDAFAAFVSGIQFLPQTIMMVALCPPGSEGISYALFTTTSNSALLLAPAIGTRLLPIWDVSKEALVAGQFDGIYNLTVLCLIFQALPIAFLFLLPSSSDELMNLNADGGRSRLGGSLFLTIVISSLAYTITVGVLNIVNPGRDGES